MTQAGKRAWDPTAIFALVTLRTVRRPLSVLHLSDGVPATPGRIVAGGFLPPPFPIAAAIAEGALALEGLSPH